MNQAYTIMREANNPQSVPYSMPIPSNRMKWLEAYTAEPTSAHSMSPDRFAYDSDRIPEVAARMLRGIETGNVNLKSPILAATCSRLGVKFSLAAIQQYINS